MRRKRDRILEITVPKGSQPGSFADLVGHVERYVLKGVQLLDVIDVDTKHPVVVHDPLKRGGLLRAIRDRGHR